MHDFKSNKELLEEYDKYVFGQLQAKKAIINLVNRSIIRYYQKFKYMNENYRDLESHKILLVGDSGCGKSYSVETMCKKLMHRPYIKIDCTDLAPSSASHGVSVEDVKKLIRSNAKELVGTRPEYKSVEGVIDQTIVFFDEIDKQTKPSDSSGNWHLRVQQALLTLLDGYDEEFAGVSYIFAGAFVGLNEQIEKSKKPNGNSIGFHNTSSASDIDDLDLSAEIIKYGIAPELAGRLRGVYVLDKLTKENYLSILNGMLIPQKERQMSFYGTDKCVITDEQKLDMVNKAVKSQQGVRYLKRELDALFMDYEFNYEDFLSEDIKLLNYRHDGVDVEDYMYDAYLDEYLIKE